MKRIIFIALALLLLSACTKAEEIATVAPTQSIQTSVSATIPTETPTQARTITATSKSTDVPEPTVAPTAVPTLISTATPVPFMKTSGFGQSANGTEMTVTRLGTGEKVVLLIGGLHAGYSPGTINLVEKVIDYYTQNEQALPADIALYVLTNANPDSVAGEEGDVNGRLNGNGVDLNRNWDCNWTADAQWRGQSVSGGNEPFSEPEVQALRDFIIFSLMPEAVVVYDAVGGIVVPGVCNGRSVSEDLAAVYAEAADYKTNGISGSTVTGDLTDWLNSNGIPAIAPLLSDYTEMDWEQNLAGVEAVLDVVMNTDPLVVYDGNLLLPSAPPETITADNYCANVTEIPESECDVLMTLYANGYPRYSEMNFETLLPCSWYEIECEGGHVTEIDFQPGYFYLEGPLPTEIGSLLHLTKLRLPSNLSSIPAEIGNLTNLTTLRIGSEDLTKLPPEIGNLTQLNELSLDFSQLNELPPEMANLSNLEYLSVSSNQFDVVTAVNNLPSITKLAFYRTGLPSGIGDLKNITHLILWETKIDSQQVLEKYIDGQQAFQEIFELTKLTSLKLYEADIQDLPPEIGNLTNLTSLVIDDNNLSSLPPELGNLTNLTNFRFAGKNFSYLPPEIGNLTNLTSLNLNGNPELDTIPFEIGNLTNLTALDLSVTSVNSLPSELCASLPDGIKLSPENLCVP